MGACSALLEVDDDCDVVLGFFLTLLGLRVDLVDLEKLRRKWVVAVDVAVDDRCRCCKI